MLLKYFDKIYTDLIKLEHFTQRAICKDYVWKYLNLNQKNVVYIVVRTESGKLSTETLAVLHSYIPNNYYIPKKDLTPCKAIKWFDYSQSDKQWVEDRCATHIFSEKDFYSFIESGNIKYLYRIFPTQVKFKEKYKLVASLERVLPIICLI